MADFLLSVGVDVGLSYDQMQKDISGLVSQLNSNPPKIKVSLDIDSAAITDLKNQIANISKSASGTSKVSVGVNNTSGTKSAAADMASVAKNTRDAANAANTAKVALKGAASSTKILTQGSQEYNAALKRVNTLLAQVTHSQERWTAAKGGKSSADYQNLGVQADALRKLIQDMDAGTVTGENFRNRLSAIQAQVSSASTAIKSAGENTQTWSERIGTLSAKFGTWFSITQVIMAGVRTVKQMVNNVVELDTAMTELKKVTDESDATYDKFLSNASSRAKELGASLSDTVTSTADFARLGYNIKDAEKLSDAAIIYKNVGDGITDIGTASESIIATMQAFGITADDTMLIVDKFNDVGNKYAISSKGVGDALLRSAAAMHAAGNTIDETIALAAAANTIVQDPDKVGTTLKTVSMFLRAAKTEAEDAGESTDGMANSVSELRDELLALTGNKVDIQIDENTFKSTYQILKELSTVWDDLTDISQANILEMVGGKRNSNVVAALLENFSVAEKAMQTSANSAGSAWAENEKVLESIQGRLNILKATFQELSSTLISDALLKGLISSGTVLLGLINNIISALGGLGSTIGIIAGVTAALNLTTVISKIKSIFETIQLFFMLKWDAIFNSTFVKGLQAIPAGLKMITTGSQAAASAFTMLGGATSVATVAITALVAIIGIAIIAYQKHKQAQEEARQAAIEAANSAAESSKEISDLAYKYLQLSEEVKTNAAVKDSLISTEDELINKLGIEKSHLDDLIQKYGNYADAIKAASIEKLQENERDLRGGLTAKKETALDKSKPSGVADKGMNHLVTTWSAKDTEINHKALNALVDAGYISSGSFGSRGMELWLTDMDLTTIEGVLSAHEQLGKMIDIVSEKAGSDNEVYKELYKQYNNCTESITDYKNGISDLNQNLAQQYTMQALIGREVPKTQKEFEQYRQSVIDSAIASGEFEGRTSDISNAIDYILSQNSQFTSFMSALKQSSDTVSKVQTSINNIKKAFSDSLVINGNADSKISQMQEFNSWIDNLSDSDKEIIYDISLTKDTAEWSLNEWNNELQSLKNNTNALDILKAKVEAIEDVQTGTIQFDISEESTGVEELQSAIASSVSATGLASESISKVINRYGDLAGYNPAELFEKTANGIHLNADALRELESDYESVNKAYLDTALDEQVKKYNELTEKISSCANVQERAALIAEQNTLGQQIEQTATLASQYDGLTSAYQKWIDAQSMGEEGDMYDNIAENIKNVKELYDKGLIGTNEFRAAAQMMTNFDISDWGIEDIMKAYENGYPLMTRYFTDGQEGCRRFLSDISNLNSEWAHMNEDGSWEINFGTGNDQEIADKLGISVDAVQAIMRKLSDYGFEINLDSVFSELELTEDKLVSANEKLKELGETDIDFNFNSTSIDEVNEQIASATQLLGRFRNEDGTVNLSLEGAQDAQLVLSSLIQRKQELNKPAIMNVNTANAQTDIATVIASLQEFQTNYNKLEVDTAIGVDTTEAQTNVDEALAAVSQSSPEILAALGIDTTSAESLYASISALTPEVMVKAGLDTSLIDGYQESEHTTEGTVKWDNDTLLVDNWISQPHTATGTIKWSNDTINVKTRFEAPGIINWSGGGGARGTAFKDGSWGAKKSGIALGGELGQELVVRDGRFFTIGDYGAEFFRYKKDDIIFNAEQTKQIFEKGKITSGNRRGNALAEGTAFSGGSGRFYQSGKPITSKYVGSSSSSPSSSSSSSSKSDTKSSSKEESEFERLYKYHQHLLNMEQESLEDYLNWLVDAYKQAYEAGEIELDDFYKYEEEVYSKSKDLFKDYLNDVTHQIEMLEHQGGYTDDIVAMYRELQESVHQQAEYYRSLGLEDNSDTIQELQKQWWEYYDNIKDKIIESYEDIISNSENLIEFNQIWLDNAVSDGDYGKVKEHSSTIIAEYKKMQEVVHQQAEYYRSLGYSDTSKEVAELSKLWWEYRDNIIEAASSGFQEMVDNTRDALDEIQNFHSTLQDAADEYADKGALTVDSFKAIAEYGLEYLNYLKDENGMLVINRERINAVIAARTQQLAVDTALNYVEQLRFALAENNLDKVNRLTTATDKANSSTWGLVYANLALLDLDGQQYKAALDNVNKLRDLADDAIKGIGLDGGNSLNSANESLESIIDLVMELIKYETEEHIEALEDQIDRYKKIIDLKRESLEATKEENDYNKEVTSKISEIAKLQSRINQLSLDDSREAQAEKKSLEEELSELQTDLADYQADYSLDKQLDSLDDMSDAYEEEKNKEIEIARESISSTEKLYRLAVERITDAWENDWDGLFQDIIAWNYDAGSSIESEIVDRWNKATEALKKYGLTLDAINGKMSSSKSDDDSDNIIVSASNEHIDIKPITDEMKSNSLKWMTSSTSEQKKLNSRNRELADKLQTISEKDISFKDGLWYWDDGTPLYSIGQWEAVDYLTKAMRDNSNKWNSSSNSEKKELERLNERLAQYIEQYSGKTVRKDGNGVWWIGSEELYKSYGSYHTGGIVGDRKSLKDSEVLACLEKGELVLDKQKKDSLYEYIDISTYMLERFGTAIDLMHSIISSGNIPIEHSLDNIGKEVVGGIVGIKDRDASCIIEKLEVTAPIQVTEKLDKTEIRKHAQTIGAISADYIQEGFTKRGIKPTTKRF